MGTYQHIHHQSPYFRQRHSHRIRCVRVPHAREHCGGVEVHVELARELVARHLGLRQAQVGSAATTTTATVSSAAFSGAILAARLAVVLAPDHSVQLVVEEGTATDRGAGGGGGRPAFSIRSAGSHRVSRIEVIKVQIQIQYSDKLLVIIFPCKVYSNIILYSSANSATLTFYKIVFVTQIFNVLVCNVKYSIIVLLKL